MLNEEPTCPVLSVATATRSKKKQKKTREEEEHTQNLILHTRFGLHHLYRAVSAGLKKHRTTVENSRAIAPTGFKENTSGQRPQDVLRWEDVTRSNGVQCPNPDCTHGFVGRLQSDADIAEANRNIVDNYQQSCSLGEGGGI